MEGLTAKRDFRERRKSEKSFVFLSSIDLISCNFCTTFAHFQKKGTFTRGAKILQYGNNTRAGGVGGWPQPGADLGVVR